MAAVEPIVGRELEQIEQMAAAASQATMGRDAVLASTRAYVSGALSTLVHLGLVTPDEDQQWRERLASSLDDGSLDPERIRNACRRGFADRGKSVVTTDGL
jgi:hypothetical protein